jgi:hypothetical protein
MPNPVVIENPVINAPLAELACHFKSTDTGLTNEITPGRTDPWEALKTIHATLCKEL